MRDVPSLVVDGLHKNFPTAKIVRAEYQDTNPKVYGDVLVDEPNYELVVDVDGKIRGLIITIRGRTSKHSPDSLIFDQSDGTWLLPTR